MQKYQKTRKVPTKPQSAFLVTAGYLSQMLDDMEHEMDMHGHELRGHVDIHTRLGGGGVTYTITAYGEVPGVDPLAKYSADDLYDLRHSMDY